MTRQDLLPLNIHDAVEDAGLIKKLVVESQLLARALLPGTALLAAQFTALVAMIHGHDQVSPTDSINSVTLALLAMIGLGFLSMSRVRLMSRTQEVSFCLAFGGPHLILQGLLASGVFLAISISRPMEVTAL